MNTTLSEKFACKKIAPLSNLVNVEEVDTIRQSSVRILGVHKIAKIYRCVACNKPIQTVNESEASCLPCGLTSMTKDCPSNYQVKVFVRDGDQNLPLVFTENAIRTVIAKMGGEAPVDNEALKKQLLGAEMELSYDVVKKVIVTVI